jgi:ABC-type antimicrobial peptide transport system permease subunit
MVRINQGNEKEVISHLLDFYQNFNPGYTLDYHFLGDEFQTLYNSEYRMSRIGSFFALLAIIISCLGLFGLTTFSVQTRKKEIGIRKLLGSSIQNLVAILSMEFVRMILLAMAIAIPATYYIAGSWLEEFAFRTKLSVWDFSFAASVVLLIGAVTIGIQTIKAAFLNPVQTIRLE